MMQEFTKNIFFWKQIFQAVTMVKSVKVPEKYFLYLGVVKSNNIGNFCKDLTLV